MCVTSQHSHTKFRRAVNYIKITKLLKGRNGLHTCTVHAWLFLPLVDLGASLTDNQLTLASDKKGITVRRK